MHLIERRVEEYIAANALLSDRSLPVIVTLSGGADSVAMLSVLTTLGYRCVAAHCNFHLRGDESDRDERHACDVARRFGAEFVVTHFDVERFRIDSPRPVSIEMACRELRYRWFESLRVTHRAQAIAVAHNANDNIETLFLNLLRGCGISGLRGMQPVNDRHVVRPMLCCYREEIEQYLEDRHIGYITDSSNLENDYKRNCLRNEVLPVIRRFFPTADRNISASISHLADNEQLYRHMLNEKSLRYIDATGAVDLNRLCGKEPYPEMLLYEWLSPKGLSKSDVIDIVSRRGISGNRYGSYYTDHGWLRPVTNKTDRQIALNDIFEITAHPISDFSPERNPDIAYFDNSVMATDLHIRFWQPGDRIAPYGMKGSKKLSDLFSDAKLSLEEKARIPLLMSGDTILWVAGIRASRHFPVTADSKGFISVRYIGHSKI